MPAQSPAHGNLASRVLVHGVSQPNHTALIIPTQWSAQGVEQVAQISFGELASRVARLQAGLGQEGFVPGDRVIVMRPVGIDLYALVLAMLASGVVAVLIDAGMSRGRILRAIRDARARAIVSVHGLLRHRFWLPALWGMRRYVVDGVGLGLRPFEDLMAEPVGPPDPLPRGVGDPALISFTSGSTGRPKGADRTHDLLIAQHEALSDHFPADDDEIDMPCFPVVTLHNLCCGITTVIPAVDFRAPATVAPAVVAEQIRQHGVTRMSGAPAYMGRLMAHLEETGERLDGVRRLAIGGGPVPVSLCRRVRRVMPHAGALVIYGSTEAEPISSVNIAELIDAPGEGYLVGRPARVATVAIVALPEPAPTLDERQMAPYAVACGQPGELVVRGPHVLRRYVNNPQADRETKLTAPDGGVWHRTGDVATRDEQGRLWLVGRTPDQIRRGEAIIHPLPIEAAIDAVWGVQQAALVAHRRAPEGELALCVRPEADADKVVALVRACLDEQNLGPDPTPIPIQIVAEMPVDGRHNSKIDRTTLRRNLERR